jgi:hypothetical protein
MDSDKSQLLIGALLSVAALASTGCGTTKQSEATQQLLASDAVDRSIAAIDFRPLAGETVFFDTKYLTNYKGIGFVNAEYVISSLRQQMFAAGCLVQDKLEDAEYVVEARVGTLGNDEHEIVYGIPANNGLATASAVVPNAPPLPSIPEISVARKHNQRAAAKVAAFAYHRKTHAAVWQSGLSVAKSSERDTWVLGAGPFEKGAIHDGWEFAGTRVGLPWQRKRPTPKTGPIAEYSQEMVFARPKAASSNDAPAGQGNPADAVLQTSAESPAQQPAAGQLEPQR